MSQYSIDLAKARAAARVLRREVSDLTGGVANAIAFADSMSGDPSVTAEARNLVAIIAQEAELSASVLTATADLAEAADNGLNHHVLALMETSLAGKLNQLGRALDDGDGATGSPADVRAALHERAFGDAPHPSPTAPYPAGYDAWFANEYAATVLASATPSEAAAFWASLRPVERAAMIGTRPDIVVFQIVSSGAAMTDAELRELDAANAYGVSTSRLTLDVDAEIDLKVWTIDLGAGVSLAVTNRSDGTVRMVVLGKASAGVSREFDTQYGEVSAGLAAVLETSQVLQFDNGADAQQAIDDLRAAVADDLDLSWGDAPGIARGILGGAIKWNVMTGGPLNPVNNWAGNWIGGDSRPESLQELGELFDEHGITSTDAIGIEGSANVGFDISGIEATGGIDLSFMLYDTDSHNGGGPGQTGAVLSGTFSGNGSTVDGAPTLPGLPTAGQTGSVEGGFVQDFYRDDNGNSFSETTLFFEVGAGTVAEVGFGDTIVDAANSPTGSAIEVSGSNEATTRFAYTIKLPVNDETTGAIGDLASGLANGGLSEEALGELWESAEVSVSQSTGLSTTVTVEAEAGPVEVTVALGTSASVTVVDLHKAPGGEMYDRIEADGLIAERLDVN